MIPEDTRPGKAPACIEERKERQELAEVIGGMAKDVRGVRDEIGEEPKTMSTDPEERAGKGLKAILYNMRAEQNSKLEQVSKDIAEIKQQLPAAVSARFRARLVSWGALAGAIVAIAGMLAGCYSIAKSVSTIAHGVQVVQVK